MDFTNDTQTAVTNLPQIEKLTTYSKLTIIGIGNKI